jgi:putative transposase
LPAFGYTGVFRYSLTLCTFDRLPAFAEPPVVATVLSQLRSTAAKEGFAVLAYCFMKDHLHLLLAGDRDDSDLRRFVVRFRQASGYWYAQATGRRLWQEGYYDHVLRSEEDTRTVVRYLLGNPVRAGLTDSIGEYPWAGSDLFRIEDIVADLAPRS